MLSASLRSSKGQSREIPSCSDDSTKIKFTNLFIFCNFHRSSYKTSLRKTYTTVFLTLYCSRQVLVWTDDMFSQNHPFKCHGTAFAICKSSKFETADSAENRVHENRSPWRAPWLYQKVVNAMNSVAPRNQIKLYQMRELVEVAGEPAGRPGLRVDRWRSTKSIEARLITSNGHLNGVLLKARHNRKSRLPFPTF